MSNIENDEDYPDCSTDRERGLYASLMLLASAVAARRPEWRGWVQAGLCVSIAVLRSLRIESDFQPTQIVDLSEARSSAVSAGPVSCAICGARIGEPCGTSPPACGDDPPISVPAPSASVREALELALSAFHEQGIAERVPVTLGRIERVLASLSAPDLADVLPQAAPVTDADLGDLSGHAVNCDWFESYDDSRCRCSLRLRQQIATERAMHRAWRKRAEEAETMVRHMLEGLPQSQVVSVPSDDAINSYLKNAGEWVEPFTAERECGVAIECDMSQEDADYINAEARDKIREIFIALSRPERG